ncbi:MAG: CPBP family intramembrane metalloprotease, partial [Myxococcales bacterium]|nr:CPBP family intramembrane metalloprotease [Myxococcales bacterium]
MTLEAEPVAAPGECVAPLRGERFARASGRRLLHALGVVAVQVAWNGVGFGVIAPLLLGGEGFAFRGAPMEFVAVFAIAALGVLGGVGLALCALGRVSLSGLGWRRVGAGCDVVAGVAAFALCFVVVLGTTAWAGGGAAVRELLASIGSCSVGRRLLFTCIGVTAAFYEESIFRGYLQPAMVARLGPLAGVVLTAALFAL